MKAPIILAIFLVLVACVAGCKTINQNDNDGGTQTVVQGIGPTTVSLSGDVVKGGIQKKVGESLQNIQLEDGDSNPISVTPDGDVSDDLELNFPAPDGYEWEGFVTDPIYADVDQTFTLEFEVTGADEYHTVRERGTFVGDTWEEGYSGEFHIGPVPDVPGLNTQGFLVLTTILILVVAYLLVRSRRRREAIRY